VKLDRFMVLPFVTLVVLSTPLRGIEAQNRIDTWTTDILLHCLKIAADASG
jgi:hypothetical protein